jgi:hypothetical protein
VEPETDALTGLRDLSVQLRDIVKQDLDGLLDRAREIGAGQLDALYADTAAAASEPH